MSTSVEQILFARLFELGNQVGKHAAGYLVKQGVGVDAQHLGTEQAVGNIFSRRVAQYSRTTLSLLRSSPVSYGVPLNAATIDSVGAWEVPIARGDIAVSTISTPASTALMMAIEAMPEV